jgi:hypothetical protein
MTDFIVEGPYEIATYKAKQGRRINEEEGRAFFEGCADLAFEKGCFIFATRAGRGYRPWYVGKATKSFRQECFTHHKLNKFNKCLADRVRCTPVLFFVVAKNARGMKGDNHIADVERFLIQNAMAANPDLLNIRGTRAADWSIAGVFPSKGRVSAAAGWLKRMLKVQ